jgi:hypothetical protein
MAKSAAVAGLVAAAEPDADGQGAAAAELAAAGALAAGALAAGALAAGALAAGALAAGAGALALAAAEAHEPRADCAIVVELPLETAMMIPRVRPSAIGMARGTAIRAARLLLPLRRRADLCPLSIQSTSMDVLCCSRCITVDRPRGRYSRILQIRVLSGFNARMAPKPGKFIAKRLRRR